MSTLGDLQRQRSGEPGDDLEQGAGPESHRPTGAHRVASTILALVGVAAASLLARIVMFPGGVFMGYGNELKMPSTVDGVALIGMDVRGGAADGTLEISATARVAPSSATSITEIVVCHNDGGGSSGIGALDQWSDLRLYCRAVEPARHAQLGPHDSLVAVVVPLASGTITIEGVDVTRHRFGRDITEHSGTKANIEVAG
jgi:hypothetical protein